MNVLRVYAALLATLASTVAADAAQTVRGSYWWKSDTATLKNESSVFSPSLTAVQTGKTVTFSALPGIGLKAITWYRWNGMKPITVSQFVEIGEGDTLDWTYDATLGTSVTLGLELDWISYSLKYETGATTTLRYTNEVTIADCTAVKTGYSFGGAWTNAQGVSYRTGSTSTGGDFAITNHNDAAQVVLYPTWTAKTYEVTLDRQGGSGGTESIQATYDRTPDAIAVPTRVGHAFDGYFTQQGGKGTRYYAADGTPSQAWKETAVTSLYANWIIDRFTVDVQAEGNGTVSADPTGGTYDYGTTLKLTATPTNEGTEFSGWSDGSQENPRELVVTSNATYTANFSTKKFLVVWMDDSRFGSTTIKEEIVEWGKDATKPDTPTHDGYTFIGWTEDGKDIRANTTISATYSANTYKVWMDKNDGTETPERTYRLYTYDVEGVLPANTFVRTGYAFQGWGTNKTESVVVYADKAKVWNWATHGEVEIYAVWKPHDYVVRFDPGEGTGTMDDQKFVYDQAQPLNENRFTCGDRTFIGWKGDDGQTYSDCQSVSNLTAEADGVAVLTAKWSTTIHVAFDGNGATNEQAMAIQDFAGPDDEQCLSSNEYGRVGYAFVGWATNREDAAAQKITYRDGEKVRIKVSAGSTLTLYATWKANTYYVAFDPGEGWADVPLTVLKATYGIAFDLPDVTGRFTPPNPDLDGFDRWTDATNGTAYANCATVSNLCAEAGATNVLTAAWKLDVGEWSERLNCTTLRWKQSAVREGGAPQWSRSGLVSQVGGGWGTKEWLEVTVRTNGVLKLSCRLNGEDAAGSLVGLAVGFVSDEEDEYFNWSESGLFATNILIETAGEWVTVSVPVALRAEETRVVIRLANSSLQEDALIEVNDVSWTPEGSAPGGDEPKEGEDNPEVRGVSVKDGKIVIKATSDRRFGYRILQSPTLTAPVKWEVREGSYQDGQDGTQTFEVPIGAGERQMFYKVEVLKRQE